MINRRNFIKYISSAAVINFLIPVPFSFPTSKDEYKNSAIKTLINLILPIKSVDILKHTQIFSELNKNMLENSKLNKVVEYGIQWLDFNSKLLYEKDKFLEIQDKEKIEILNYTFNSRQSAYPAEPDKPWTDIRYGKLFLNNLRSFTMNAFYTSDTGWKFLGYNGPPQYNGNLDYGKCSN